MGSLWMIYSFGLLLGMARLPIVASETFPPRLILISMDGLMYDLLDGLPAESRNHFDYFIQNGVLAKQILNVFPSVAYPNHYTFITGLYPESHGLVANQFYDPNFDESFSISNGEQSYESKWFDVGAEPIYVTNAKAGGERKSGTVLFPTGLARVKGVAPDFMVEDDGTYSNQYNSLEFPYVKMPYQRRVERLISWFTDKKNPINLGLLFFPEPNELSEAHGPRSVEVKNEVGGPLNDALGYLINMLREHDLLESTNIILTADHGQTAVQKIVILQDYINPTSYTKLKGNIVVSLYPNTGRENEIVRNLTRCPDIHVYKKSDSELLSMHYTRSRRIAPIILIAKEGVVITRTKTEAQGYKKVGAHGYDPVEVPAMKPVFMAVGPDFRKGIESRQFNSVDIYPLMCHLLGIMPAPNNGSLSNVRHLLATSSKEGMDSSAYMLLTGILSFFIFGRQ